MGPKRKRREEGLSQRTVRRRRAEGQVSVLTDPNSDSSSSDEDYSVSLCELFAVNPPSSSSSALRVSSQRSEVGCESERDNDCLPPNSDCDDASPPPCNQLDEWSDSVDCGSLLFDCDTCIDCRCIVACNQCKHNRVGECSHCEWCRCRSYGFHDDDEHFEDEEPEEFLGADAARNQKIKDDFTFIVHKHLVKNNVVDDLLTFFRKWDIGDFPKSSKTLLKTPLVTHVREVPPGEYWHRGITTDLISFASTTGCDVVNIYLGVDGLPLAKSSNRSFWPLLCSFNKSADVILAGAYHGFSKPHDSDVFLQDFIEEIGPLCTNGLVVEGKRVNIVLHCLNCDAPAKAFVLKFKNCNGYFSCPKCTQEGEMDGRRMCFPEIDAPLRTDEGFRAHQQKEHHVGNAAIQDVPTFNPVSSVPYDYMHLVLLGVVRKVMYMWLQGPLNVRLRARTANLLSDTILSLVPWKPRELCRRLRHLQFIKRYKATQFRQILLYVGPVALEKVLPRDLYDHFLVLHVAITILAHPSYPRTHVDYAGELLKLWVLSFKTLYGAAYMSHNVHGLIHLAADVRKFGSLDEFSNFKFENFMQYLLKLVRKGEKPLQQLARRYGELAAYVKGLQIPKAGGTFSGQHMDGPLPADCTNPQFRKFQMPGNIQIDTSDANNCCSMNDGSVIIVKNFACSRISKKTVVVGRKFVVIDNLYTTPLPSSELGIHYVKDLSALQIWPVDRLSKKMYRMPFKEGFAVVPLLHAEVPPSQSQ